MALHDGRNSERKLRLWPGVVLVTLQWAIRLFAPIVYPAGGPGIAIIGADICGVLVLLWWAFFSRVPHIERWGAILVMIVAVAATPPILHRSIAGGMMGMMFYIFVLPVLSLALVGWAVVSRRLDLVTRRATLVASIVVACGLFALLRTDGITGDGRSQLAWRWSVTAEQRLLARSGVEPVAPVPAPVAEKPVEKPRPAADAAPGNAAPSAVPPARAKAPSHIDWPGFRGPHRDSVVAGVRINTDWSASKPLELWRQPVGPGWSSFAVADGLLYTQEQRGDFEIVSCYSIATGKPVWTHRDGARFYESNGGAGPRATPTLSGGLVYTFGATGILNALDARTGTVVWTRNAASDTGAKIPGWGFSGSPLVVDDMVIVAASGRLAAYDAATGSPRWRWQAKAGSYSSPQLLTIDGVPQVVMLTGTGPAGISPADGKLLWEHEWKGTTILQPALTADGDVLITTGDMSGGVGTRRLAVARGPAGWKIEERWTSRGLKPYFNDIVVHKGHAYGFDGGILSCIDLQNGDRKWKGGRYGHGQMLLLTDQDLLVVLSEEGELALVTATPDRFTEVAKITAIEGKTWNHPVVVRDVLLVRNGQEMVAFRLPLLGS